MGRRVLGTIAAILMTASTTACGSTSGAKSSSPEDLKQLVSEYVQATANKDGVKFCSYLTKRAQTENSDTGDETGCPSKVGYLLGTINPRDLAIAKSSRILKVEVTDSGSASTYSDCVYISVTAEPSLPRSFAPYIICRDGDQWLVDS